MGIVAVVSGDGFKQIFEELGADYIIEGGQTMNPSAEDIARGIKQINAKNIIILPNNKNITLAAQQAAHLCEDKAVFVIETKTMPQGIAALMNYLPDAAFDDCFEDMQGGFDGVTTGQITVAVRDTTTNGHKISQGDYIGIFEGDIVCAHQEIDIAAKELVNIMMAEGSDMFTIYKGQDATESTSIENYVRENYENCEFGVFFGGQGVYHYIFAAE